MSKANTIDRQVKCDFCGKLKRESAMIYVVRDGQNGKYVCSQKCADLANKLIRPHTKGGV